MDYQQEFLQRVPPHSRELEEAVLSAILQEPKDAFPIAAELLSPASFYYEQHSVIFRACDTLLRQGNPPDPLTLIAYLRENGKLDAAGGETYIFQILAAVPNASAIQVHATILHDKQMLRDLISTANDVIAEAYHPAADVEQLLDDTERRILAIDSNLGGTEFPAIDDAIRSFMESFDTGDHEDGGQTNFKPPPVITSGYADVDKYTGGWRDGEFIVIGARPSVGKTAIAVNFAYHAAMAGKRIGIFSLEMSKEQLASRMLSMSSLIPAHRVRGGNFSIDELERLQAAYTELAELPIYFADDAAITARSLRGRARRMKQKYEIDLLIVDYLQLMTADISRRGEHNRVNEMTEISRCLKAVARELKIPVIVASQLSCNAEWRQDKRPMLSDLRDSGSIEQDADVVILLYRNDYYDKEAADTGKSKVEIDIAKNRNGRTGRAYLTMERDYTRFVAHTKDEQEVTI